MQKFEFRQTHSNKGYATIQICTEVGKWYEFCYFGEYNLLKMTVYLDYLLANSATIYTAG